MTGGRRTAVLVASSQPEAVALFRALCAGAEKEGAMEWRRVDGRAGEPDPGGNPLLGVLSGAAAVVYAAGFRARDPRTAVDLDDARTVLGAAVAAGVPRLVALSSTEVHQPSHRHLGLLSEDRFHPRSVTHRWSRSWIALEDLVAELAGELAEEGSAPSLTVLRAAPLAVRGGREFFSRLLSRPLAATVPGFDPSIQLLAPEDLARAIERVLAAPGAGERAEHGAPTDRVEGVERADLAEPVGSTVYNIVPQGTAPLHKAIRLAGGRRLPVPLGLQRLARRLLGPTRRVAAPERADFLRYPWTASGARAARELGFTPRWSTADVAARIGGGSPGSASARWEWGVEGIDPFGMDRDYVARYGRTLFRFLHDLYWRVEFRGLEHVPRTGRGVFTGVHRGFMPYDGAMALHLLVRETGRYPRFLLHPTLTKFPFLANFMTKLGGIMACRENADWVLDRDGLVGIFPEGIDGAFTPYRHAYRLGPFGRDEYVRMALRNRAPIIPFVTVGSAEIYPILGRIDWAWWKRLSEWPYLPITPTFPVVPLPLPSKWHTRVLEPLHVEEEHGPEAAEDPEVVGAISAEVRRRMEEAIAEMLARRRSIFFGSIFDEAPETPSQTSAETPSEEGEGGPP